MAAKKAGTGRGPRGPRGINVTDMEYIVERLDQIGERTVVILARLTDIQKSIQDNGDTSPEDVETYLNKIGRMLASDKYEVATGFLRSVFQRVEQRRHITKRQMEAVDRIEQRGSAASLSPSFSDNFPWGED